MSRNAANPRPATTAPAASRNVELPPDPHQRITLPHQEAVAEIRLGGGIENLWRAVEVADDVLAPTIEHIEQRDAIAERGVLWPQNVEISSEGHAPGGIAWRLIEIDDRLIA